jgi:hypothetical protein
MATTKIKKRKKRKISKAQMTQRNKQGLNKRALAKYRGV